MTIFVFDEHGKMVRKHKQPLIDGTLLGPDHLAELVAYHLHRLGVAEAEVVVFAADGAPWIWDRIEWIVRPAGLDRNKVVQGLDFCHASRHISLALRALGLKRKGRKQRYRQLREWLKEGGHREIVSELRRPAEEKENQTEAKANSKTGKVWTEIRYLEKHGLASRLDYASFRQRGLPLGSGTIESTIRRVINLRQCIGPSPPRPQSPITDPSGRHALAAVQTVGGATQLRPRYVLHLRHCGPASQQPLTSMKGSLDVMSRGPLLSRLPAPGPVLMHVASCASASPVVQHQHVVDVWADYRNELFVRRVWQVDRPFGFAAEGDQETVCEAG